MPNSTKRQVGCKDRTALINRARNWKQRRQTRGEPVVLLVHRSGRWARKINGSLSYFGPVTDSGDFGYFDALERHNAAITGEDQGAEEGLTLLDLCNHYLEIKEEERDRGELTEAHFGCLHRTGKLLLEQFGRIRSVETMGPRDFDKLYRLIVSWFTRNWNLSWLAFVSGGGHPAGLVAASAAKV